MTNRTIAVLMPAMTNTLYSNLLNGIYTQAKKLGYDVLVFTNASNSLKEHPLTEYVRGEENIYRLAEIAEFDGIILAAGCFLNPDLIERIIFRLEKLKKPCLVLEYMQDRLPYIYPSQKEGIRQATRHLIEVHGCRKLHCLTGIKGTFEAEERLSAFLETLAEYGIDADENTYTYGDFWKQSAWKLAEYIFMEETERPEGVVCASDIMALSLCDGLKFHGLRVPEDIRVTGYDGIQNAYLSNPVLTTFDGKDEYLGQTAVMRLHEMMGGSVNDAKITAKTSLKLGTSCGCSADIAGRSYQLEKDEYLKRDHLYNNTFLECYMTSNFIGQMSDSDSLKNFAEIVDSLAHLLPLLKRLDICLCEDWLGDFKKFNEYRTADYPEYMVTLLSKDRESRCLEQYRFQTKELLPVLMNPHEPEYIVFIPIHSQNHILGYAALSYESGKHFLMEERVHNWCDAVANGLRNLRQKLYMDYMHDKIEQCSVRDPTTGMYNRKGLVQKLPFILEYAKNQNNSLLMILLTWKQETGSVLNHESDNSIMVANILQMSCKPDEQVARLEEKIFAILIPVPVNTEASEQVDQKLLQLVEMSKKIHKQIAFALPRLETDFILLTDLGSFELQLEDTLQRLKERLRCVILEKHDYVARLSQMRLEMKMTPQSEWSAETAATEIGISKSYFQRLYKQQFGIAFTEDVIMARINKAKKLLKTSNLRIQEIAEQCGYENASHFMRQFKDRVGITAVQYRKQQHT